MEAVGHALAYYAPKVPEAHRADGLLAWLWTAAQRAPELATVEAVTREAWGQSIPPAALSNRFRAAGLLAPRVYQDAIRLAVLGYAIGAGLTVREWAGGDPRPWYRVCRKEAGPYNPSSRIVLETMKRRPAWAAERWLVPLLVDVPPDAWVRPSLLTRLPKGT